MSSIDQQNQPSRCKDLSPFAPKKCHKHGPFLELAELLHGLARSGKDAENVEAHLSYVSTESHGTMGPGEKGRV